MSNKTSDKNVANVEDDVKILKEFAEICKRGISVYNPQEEGEALERILAELEQKDKRIQELEEELAKYKDIDYMFKIDSNENRVDMKKIYFEWLEYKNKIQKLEEESEILEFQNKQVENYAEELKKYNKTVSDRIVEYKKNSIPTQIVIDKVNEINKKYEDSKDENGESPYYYPDFTIRILQELLEREKNELER